MGSGDLTCGSDACESIIDDSVMSRKLAFLCERFEVSCVITLFFYLLVILWPDIIKVS